MKFTKISVVALLLVLCLCLFAGCGEDKTTETDAITEADPVVTESDKETAGEDPVVTDPVVTDPEETDPVETDPKETDPVVIDPVETDPKETDPKETEPKETEPKETDPKETVGEHVCSGVNMTTDATCYQEGSYTTVCSICGKFMSRTVFAPKLPHTPDEAKPATCEAPQLCIVCNAVVVEPLGHEFVGAYASENDMPTCAKTGTMTFTCVRGDNAEEHAKGTAGAVYTESVPTVPHEFKGDFVYTAPSLFVAGSEVGECKWCGPNASNPIDPQIFVDFDEFEEGTLTADILNAEGSPFAVDFTSAIADTQNKGRLFSIVKGEDGNQFLQKVGTSQLTLTSKTNKLSYEKFEVSFTLHVDSMDASESNYNGGIFSIKDGAEKRVLSLMRGKQLCFGKLDSGVYLLRNDIFQGGEAEPIDIKIVVDPVNYDYEIWLDGEKVLYTEIVKDDPSKHTVYTPDGDGWKATEVSSSSSSLPFAQSGKGINVLYFFHFSNWNVSVDDLCIKVPTLHTCNETHETVESTCTKLGYTRTYCSICGAESSRVDAEKLADHQYNLEAATCTENKKCTVCGEIAEKATGHKGTTIVPSTFCVAGSEKGTCSVCGEDVDKVIPAGIVETFENDTVGSKATFSNLSKVFTASVASALTVAEDANGNKYWTKDANRNAADLYVKDDILSGNNFTISFDFEALNSEQGGILGFNSRTKQAMKSDGTSKYNSAKGATYDEMRILSMKTGGGVNFWDVDNDMRILNPKAGMSYHFEIQVYPTLTDGILTNIDYKIYIDGELVLETSGTGTYVNTTDGYTYPVKTIKYRALGAETFKETTHSCPRPDNKTDGVQNPFYTVRAYHEGEEKWTQIESLHFFHFSKSAHNIDNLGISVEGVEHKYEEKINPATCVATGEKWKECAYCGDVIDRETIDLDPSAHSEGEPEGDTATCLAGGTATINCAECGGFIGTIDTEPLDHAWGNWTYDVSLCEAGTRTRSCDGNNTDACTKVQTENLAAGIYLDFDNVEDDTEVTADDFAATKPAFPVSGLESSYRFFREGSNGFLEKLADDEQPTINFADNEQLLNTKNFTLSFDLRMRENGGNNGGIISFKDGSKEHRILAIQGNGAILYFGHISDASKVNLTRLKYGENAEWLNVKLVVTHNPLNYEVWLDNVKTLYTEKSGDNYIINKADGNGGYTQSTVETSKLQPLSISNISSFYLFHYNISNPVQLDNFSLVIDGMAHNYKEHVNEPTCTEPGLSWNECANCGHKKDETDLPADESKHNKSNLIVDDDATCEKTGLGHYECTLCGNQMGDDVTIDKLPHTFDEATVVVTTPATFTTEGAATGTCTECGGTELPMVIRRQISVDFNDDSVVDASNETLGSLVSPFAVSSNKSNATYSIGEEGGDKFWNVKITTAGNSEVKFKDTTADKLLNTQTWKVSMKIKLNDLNSNMRFIVWRNGSTERSIVGCRDGRLVFGKNNTTTASQYVYITEAGALADANGAPKWVNVAAEMDPVNRTYKVYFENELVLYTDTNNKIYLVNDGVATLYSGTFSSSDKSPFQAGGSVDELVFFRFSTGDMSIDDFKIEIMDYLPASAE